MEYYKINILFYRTYTYLKSFYMLFSLVFRLFFVWLYFDLLLNHLFYLLSNKLFMISLDSLLYFCLLMSFSNDWLLFNNFWLFCLYLLNNFKWLSLNSRDSFNSNFLFLNNLLSLFNSTNKYFTHLDRPRILLHFNFLYLSNRLNFRNSLIWVLLEIFIIYRGLNRFFLGLLHFLIINYSWSWTWSLLLLSINFSESWAWSFLILIARFS